jgi:hypothetical protein
MYRKLMILERKIAKSEKKQNPWSVQEIMKHNPMSLGIFIREPLRRRGMTKAASIPFNQLLTPFQ